jgi:hypothetical protein
LTETEKLVENKDTINDDDEEEMDALTDYSAY